MYSMKLRVRYSEVDSHGVLKLTSLVDYLQDCSTFHSEDVDMGVEKFAEMKRAWLLISWQIVIHELPRFGETVEVITNPYDFDRFMGYRNFMVRREDGSICVIANSNWVYMDMERQRPVRVDEAMALQYGMGERFEMEYAPRKLELPPKDARPDVCVWRAAEPFYVMSHHLDTNCHVNNGQYIRMANDYLPDDYPIGQIRVEYKKQAKLGDRMIPRIGRMRDARYLIELGDEAGDAYAIVEFTSRASEKERTAI